MTRTNVWRSPAFSAALLFSSLICASAYGADCGPLKEVAAIDLTVAQNGVATLPVTINGSPRKLIFDTAGGRSVLSQTAVDSLGLHPLSVDSRLLSPLRQRLGPAPWRWIPLSSAAWKPSTSSSWFPPIPIWAPTPMRRWTAGWPAT